MYDSGWFYAWIDAGCIVMSCCSPLTNDHCDFMWFTDLRNPSCINWYKLDSSCIKLYFRPSPSGSRTVCSHRNRCHLLKTKLVVACKHLYIKHKNGSTNVLLCSWNPTNLITCQWLTVWSNHTKLVCLDQLLIVSNRHSWYIIWPLYLQGLLKPLNKIKCVAPLWPHTISCVQQQADI